MTERKITYALNRIQRAKEHKFHLEALLAAYYLNIDLIKFILSKASPKQTVEGLKLKEIIKICRQESLTNPTLKTIITKRSIKSCKTWLLKMEAFFKTLKLSAPTDLHSLQSETEKICGILKLSATKLLVKKK